jgi:hypothetical protein
MHHLVHRVIIGLMVFVLLASCATPTPLVPPTTAPQGVQVSAITEIDTAQREITQEKTLNQCGSVSKASAEVKFSDLSSQESSQALVLKGGVKGEITFSPLAKATLEGAIEKQYSTSSIGTFGHDESVAIEVPGHTMQEYTIVWRETRRDGTVTYTENGEQKEAQYSYRIGLEMVSSTGVDIPCPGSVETGQNPVSEPPTNSPPPPSPPTDTPVPVLSSVVVKVIGSGMGEFDETDSGQYIQAGDHVTVTYISGQWWIGKSTSSSCNGYGDRQTPTDANGYVDRDGERVAAQIICGNPNQCRPLTSAPWGSLLGRIGKSGALFTIGSNGDFIAQDSGLLYFRMNYSNHNDVTGCPYGDGGNITVRVSFLPE